MAGRGRRILSGLRKPVMKQLISVLPMNISQSLTLSVTVVVVDNAPDTITSKQEKERAERRDGRETSSCCGFGVDGDTAYKRRINT